MFLETEKTKSFKSPEFNYFFSKETGFTAVWGKDQKDDPEFAPFPMIADIEITTACAGPGGKVCPFCYKGNIPQGTYMNFSTAKKVMDALPKEITQIAFGVDASCTTNPDWFNIFSYAREVGIIPNVTVADISDETADKLASVCGAVAVSRYANKNYCYDSVKKLVDRKLKQVNIHMLLSKETLQEVYETINDIGSKEERLNGLNAIVFLSLKRKGRGVGFSSLSEEEFSNVVSRCEKLGISYGFDSCSYHKWERYILKSGKEKKILEQGEPCESSLFSCYINVEGKYFPCSFTEGTIGWTEGLDVANCTSFIQDIWNHPKTLLFRETLLSGKRNCPIYNV